MFAQRRASLGLRRLGLPILHRSPATQLYRPALFTSSTGGLQFQRAAFSSNPLDDSIFQAQPASSSSRPRDSPARGGGSGGGVQPPREALGSRESRPGSPPPRQSYSESCRAREARSTHHKRDKETPASQRPPFVPRPGSLPRTHKSHAAVGATLAAAAIINQPKLAPAVPAAADPEVPAKQGGKNRPRFVAEEIDHVLEEQTLPAIHQDYEFVGQALPKLIQPSTRPEYAKHVTEFMRHVETFILRDHEEFPELRLRQTLESATNVSEYLNMLMSIQAARRQRANGVVVKVNVSEHLGQRNRRSGFPEDEHDHGFSDLDDLDLELQQEDFAEDQQQQSSQAASRAPPQLEEEEDFSDIDLEAEESFHYEMDRKTLKRLRTNKNTRPYFGISEFQATAVWDGNSKIQDFDDHSGLSAAEGDSEELLEEQEEQEQEEQEQEAPGGRRQP